MQYKVSAKVSDQDLTQALNALHKVTQSVLVTPLTKGASSEATASDSDDDRYTALVSQEGSKGANGTLKPLQRKKHKRSIKARVGKCGTDIAIDYINENGTQAFTLANVIAKMERRGFNRHLVYRAARILVNEGKIKKLRAGIYQRTPVEPTGQLGVAARAIEAVRNASGQ